jgi:hypothetical protein
LQEEGHEIAFVGFMQYELNTVGVVPCGDDPTELCTADSAGNVVSFVDLDTVLTCNGGQFLPPDTGAGDQSNQSVGGAVQSWGQQYENLQLYPPPAICIWNGEL